MDKSADVGRVARLLAGKAVGVCFGGGGARGNVHFGVIQAMQELGIPIDVVSGTSFGALAAAMPLSRKSAENRSEREYKTNLGILSYGCRKKFSCYIFEDKSCTDRVRRH